MPIFFVDFLFFALAAVAGAAGGWWLCRNTLTPVQGDASDEKQRAEEALAQLHLLAAGVAQSVGEHNAVVGDISAELENAESGDTDTVVNAVANLLKANEAMQSQLAFAEQQLQDQAVQLESTEKQARTDALTQIGNRLAFDDAMEQCQAQFNQNGTTSSVMIIDVDHFKKFNDTYGHQAGDEVLRGVAKVLTKNARGTDIVARYGGEEFAIIFPGCDIQNSMQVAEKARAAIGEATFEHEGTTLKVTASGGVAQLQVGEDVESMIKRSDDSLYVCKEAGRNNGHWHDGTDSHPMTQRNIDEQKAEQQKAEQQKAEAPVPTQPVVAQPTPVAVAEQAAESVATTVADVVGEEAAPADTIDLFDTVEVEELSPSVDELTGLLDQETFNREAETRAADTGDEPLSLLLVQIDRYDFVVDQFGMDSAERALRTTTQLIKAVMRDLDVVARYDEDIFAVLLPAADLAEAASLAEKLRVAISRCKLRGDKDQEISFTVSQGSAELNSEADNNELFHHARTALNAAIEDGRNCTFAHNGYRFDRVEGELVSS